MILAELEGLVAGDRIAVRNGKQSKQAARFVRWSMHPTLGKMLVVVKEAIHGPSGWTAEVRILPIEVIQIGFRGKRKAT